MKNTRLNLPECNLQIREVDGDSWIWDDFRKKEILLTPEEWVRQHFLYLLTDTLNYPRSWIRVESALHYDKRRKRSDIKVLNRDGTVFLLVECKAPNVRIDQRALKQISLYNKTLSADFVAITNGLKHYFWHLDKTQNSYKALSEAPVWRK